jgi:translation initiation factor 6
LKIEKTGVQNNPFAGLFFKTSNEITLCPKNTPSKNLSQIERVLQTKPLEIFVDQSPLLGIFSCINDTGVVISQLSDRETIALLKKEGLNVFLLKRHVPGTNLLCNNKACLVNPDISEAEAKKIGDCFGVEVIRQNVGVKTVGTANAVTDKGLLAYNEMSDVELKFLEKVLKVRGLAGTTNFGSPFNGLAVVANNKGALVGESTTGVEMQRLFEALEG